MMDIVEFLTARLNEDEWVAATDVASRGVPVRWVAVGAYIGGIESHLVAQAVPDVRHDVSAAGDAVADHIARHDPARVLADVAAKRAILDLHRTRVPHGYSNSLDEMLANGSAVCSVCGDQGVDITTVYHPCDTLLVMARVWADHPDFDPAWAS